MDFREMNKNQLNYTIMKKIILFATLVLLSTMVNAQFSLTINGFVNSQDNSKDYVVFDYENINKEVLYINVLKFITTNYKSAKDVISKVENEVITINAIQSKIATCKTLKYDASYTVSISFKDSKIKIDAPFFECSSFAFGKPYRLTMSGSNGGLGSEVTVGLFKKNGEPGQKNTIIEIESFFNGLCNDIEEAAIGKSESEDW
jgi:hypothetical protein